MRKIVLASSSPRRRELLESLGLVFEVIPSDIDEVMNPRLGAHAQARSLSLQKAQAVAKKVLQNTIIIAADTIVVLDGEQIGKPENVIEAKRMLLKQQGNQQEVVTGFAILDTKTGKTISDSVETKLWMRRLSKQDIATYVRKEHTLDKAGGYAVQGIGFILFEKIEGDYANVVGLPLFQLAKRLKQFGIDLLRD